MCVCWIFFQLKSVTLIQKSIENIAGLEIYFDRPVNSYAGAISDGVDHDEHFFYQIKFYVCTCNT